MRIGYLHLGEPGHGLHRYGSLLAAEARRRGSVEVVERSVAPCAEPRAFRDALDEARSKLARADVVHVQHNRTLWGVGLEQHRNVRRFLAESDAPVVVTCHDVYPRDPWAPWRKRRWRWRRVRRHWRERVPTNRTLRLWLRSAAAVIVCSDEEARRLAALVGSGAVDANARVIDHFVEERDPLPPRQAARDGLGLASSRVVTLLGYIHPSKGHDLLVDALPHLPDDVVVVLAGRPSPGNEDFLRRLERRAERRGVADRLRVTGWLEDAEQAAVLSATDLAVAPFRFLSASGSLSTWISAGAPILAHDLPQLDRYDVLSPGAIDRFAPYEARALAGAIVDGLERRTPPDPAVERLREDLLMPRIFDRHLALYRELVPSDGTRTEDGRVVRGRAIG